MTPEQLAIAALFSLWQTGTIAVIKYLHGENKRLRQALDTSNQASADLIFVQARMLRDHGITPPDANQDKDD